MKTDHEIRMEARAAMVAKAPEKFMAAMRIIDAVGYLAFANGGFVVEEGQPGRFVGVFSHWGEWSKTMKAILDGGLHAAYPVPPAIPVRMGLYEPVVMKAYEDAGLTPEFLFELGDSL